MRTSKEFRDIATHLIKVAEDGRQPKPLAADALMEAADQIDQLQLAMVSPVSEPMPESVE